tara:strand:+ start:181 stop:1020 length:840 start_codon:yes stop_codon:yes gene_type:complete
LFGEFISAIKSSLRNPWLNISLLVTLLFLYTPIIVLIIFSFNDSRRNIVWKGFTLKYYKKMFSNEILLEAFLNSIVIALITTILSLMLGVLTAILLWRFQFPLKSLYQGMIMIPVIVPEICIGIAFLVFFNWIGWPPDLIWPLNLAKIIFAHSLFCFPFVAIVIRAKLVSLNRECEEAAKDLGANAWHVYRDIWFPHLKPSLIAGGLLAFTLSLDDFVITFFTSGPETITLPIKIYSMVRFSVTPEVNAASTVLIAVTILSVCTVIFLQKESLKKGSFE